LLWFSYYTDCFLFALFPAGRYISIVDRPIVFLGLYTRVQ
jgi:hypothetical protein